MLRVGVLEGVTGDVTLAALLRQALDPTVLAGQEIKDQIATQIGGDLVEESGQVFTIDDDILEVVVEYNGNHPAMVQLLYGSSLVSQKAAFPGQSVQVLAL